MEVEKAKKFLRLGMTIYEVQFDYSSSPENLAKVYKSTIKAINDVGSYITINTSRHKQVYSDDIGKKVFFSEKKANNVADNLNEIERQRQLRYEEEKKIYIENLAKLETYDDLKLDDGVLIKVENGEWVKSTVEAIGVTYKKDELYFVDSLRHNKYLTTREGKNWKRWTKLDELKLQKENIEKQIKDLESSDE